MIQFAPSERAECTRQKSLDRPKGISPGVAHAKQVDDQTSQNNKTDVIGQLAGGVIHDFNNLLTVISGCCDLLLSGKEGAVTSRELVQEISRAAVRATGLTRQLMAFYRKQGVEAQVLDLNGIVCEIKTMLARLLGERVEMAITLKASLPPIKADPVQIEQILLNLIINARDAMPCGGKLSVETGTARLEYADLGRRDIRPGEYVFLSVTDTGCGMDEPTLAHIFEPFFTTKDKGKGTGLGLATIARILDQSGGHIGVNSTPGKGTTFIVYLPALAAAVEHAVIAEEQGKGASGQETVLLVEDDEFVRKLSAVVLESKGYAVLEARSAEEALSLSASHDGPIDLLVADVVLPKMSGREIAKLLVQQRAEMKVLYISGYAENVLGQYGLHDVGPAFLRKPFSPQALTDRARAVLDSKQQAG
jgi:two-component system cell cycle sensor histidine kinase/response regulator CckA